MQINIKNVVVFKTNSGMGKNGFWSSTKVLDLEDGSELEIRTKNPVVAECFKNFQSSVVDIQANLSQERFGIVIEPISVVSAS